MRTNGRSLVGWSSGKSALVGIALAAMLVGGACTGGGSGSASGTGSTTTPSTAGSGSTPSLGPTPSPSAAPASPIRIEQPSVTTLNKLTRSRLAPDSARVDLYMPSFSHPTQVTNPLFPIGQLNAIIVGQVGGKPLKIETTLLPETKTVTWDGQRIEALQSQFCAYLQGRITEVAVDLYAQADDGSVWYFGEDVVDYVKGVAATTAGTWRVGLDGPAAMIMPGHPQVGDVYRTENIPGVAFEQVTVDKVGVTVQGPSGPVPGAVVGAELHQDEAPIEPKTFAPGHGEWFSGGGHDFEANALAVPVDALAGPEPAELDTLLNGAYGVVDDVRSNGWGAASAAVDSMNAAWTTFQKGSVPARLGPRMGDALAALAAAVGARSRTAAPQAALAVADAALDLQLRYRPAVDINMARYDLWARRLQADAEARNAAAVHGDVTTLAWIRNRIAFSSADGQGLDDQLRYLRSVAEAHEFGAAIAQAMRLQATLAATQPAA